MYCFLDVDDNINPYPYYVNRTPATAHSHIKRIYSKCGMHSRQEILEYLNSYGS